MQRMAKVDPSTAARPTSEATFTDLLTPLIEPGFRLALAMLRDAQAAEDAVQEASFTAWRKLGRMQDRSRLRPWFLGVDGARSKAMEHTGEALRHIDMEARLTMTNMAIEAGAKNGIMEFDSVTEEYLRPRAKRAYTPVS